MLAVTTIALLLGLFFLFANWQTIYKRSAIPVTIAVSKTPLSAPIYIADEKGGFDWIHGDGDKTHDTKNLMHTKIFLYS